MYLFVSVSCGTPSECVQHRAHNCIAYHEIFAVFWTPHESKGLNVFVVRFPEELLELFCQYRSVWIFAAAAICNPHQKKRQLCQTLHPVNLLIWNSAASRIFFCAIEWPPTEEQRSRRKISYSLSFLHITLLYMKWSKSLSS